MTIVAPDSSVPSTLMALPVTVTVTPASEPPASMILPLMINEPPVMVIPPSPAFIPLATSLLPLGPKMVPEKVDPTGNCNSAPFTSVIVSLVPLTLNVISEATMIFASLPMNNLTPEMTSLLLIVMFPFSITFPLVIFDSFKTSRLLNEIVPLFVMVPPLQSFTPSEMVNVASPPIVTVMSLGITMSQLIV